MPLEVYELKDFNGSGLSQRLAGNICAFEECRRLFIWSVFPKENMKSLSDSSFAGTLRDMLCEFGAFFSPLCQTLAVDTCALSPCAVIVLLFTAALPYPEGVCH